MFDRYTEAARGVIVSSKHKASRVGSREIDTEHLLLGLLSKDQTLARRFLGSPWAAGSVQFFSQYETQLPSTILLRFVNIQTRIA